MTRSLTGGQQHILYSSTRRALVKLRLEEHGPTSIRDVEPTYYKTIEREFLDNCSQEREISEDEERQVWLVRDLFLLFFMCNLYLIDKGILTGGAGVCIEQISDKNG
jgi:hypothetical protein